MTWTTEDAIRFHNWELDMMEVKVCQKMGIPVEPPPKPEHYDIWKSGGKKPKP